MSNFSDAAGRPYAGGPTVNDDGSAMVNTTRLVVGGGSDTTGLNAGYAGVQGRQLQGESSGVATMAAGRSAGENSGTGFAASS